MRYVAMSVGAGLIAMLLLIAVRAAEAPAAALAAPLQTVNCDIAADQHAPGAAELDMLRQVNDYRAASGLAPLVFDAGLQQGAVWKALYIAQTGTFAHDDPFRSWTQRIVDCGYPSDSELVGENLAGGAETAAGAIMIWQNSPMHNAALLDGNFAAVGIKRVQAQPGDPYGWYWVIVFGNQVITPMPTTAAQ